MVPRTTIAEKATRHDIVMLTKTYALVEGTTDLYSVWLDTMSCSCKAGTFGKPCSHAAAVQTANSLEAEMHTIDTTHLVAPTNFRTVLPLRSCESCALLTTDAAKTFCVRPNGPVYETGEQEERWNVCDGWKSFAKVSL